MWAWLQSYWCSSDVSDITAKQMHNDLVLRLKKRIEEDVEVVHYVRVPGQRKLCCQLHMRNGFIVEGQALLLDEAYLPLAKDISRKDALAKLIIIEQYNLATELHLDAMSDVGSVK